MRPGIETAPANAGAAALTRRQFFPRAAAMALGAGALLHGDAGASRAACGMRQRPLGRTGIDVSEIGFGSHLSPENLADPAGRAAQIRRGLELGINLFDVYDHSYHQYGPMGSLLAPCRQEVVISLVSVWPDGRTMAEIEHGLQAFGTDVIDLYRIYAGTDSEGDGRDSIEIRLADLRRAKEQGKVRAIGMSAHDQAVFVDVLRDHTDLDFVMFPYNFRHRALSFDTAADAAELPPPGFRDCTAVPCPAPGFAAMVRERQLGLIAMKPFGGGGLLRLPPEDPRLQPLEQAGVNLPQAALQFILQTPDIASAIPAMNSLVEVEQNVGAAACGALSEPQGRYLDILNELADGTNATYLPDRYRWLETWRT